MDEFAAYIGIDWSDKKHDCCLIDAVTGRKESSTLKHSPEAIDKWVIGLRDRFGGKKPAICLEQSRGPLIYALMKYAFLVLYPINPSTLSNYRKSFSPSGAKDDPTDADFLAEIVTTHRERLRAWQPDDEKTRSLQHLVEHRRKLIGERTRLSNRLTALLKGYFPQVLDWFPDPRTILVCDFLTRWPTLEAVKRAHRKTLEQFLRAHNSNRKEAVERRMKSIQEVVKQLLQAGAQSPHKKTRQTCQNILKLGKALWTFVRVEGVEPTNNNAERPLRRAVMWRGKSFGTQSESGSRIVERILTVVTSLRQQGREV